MLTGGGNGVLWTGISIGGIQSGRRGRVVRAGMKQEECVRMQHDEGISMEKFAAFVQI